ncbi:EthD family reductase [Runella aurantiaca]|uniref:EthD family reductase n=1 Tax=Runella aurantiaca TaxID=2282308 RepID=A0A369ID54_9BACT|nr:EthD family reductase [Runella aurantiaca]RDB07711.1 EthD family reductase [Runella aurantiaca]
MLKLLVLYPQPTDVQQFEADYKKHLELFHEKAGIPTHVKTYTITKMLPTPEGLPAFYQQFSLPFESLEALQMAVSTWLQEVGADAIRISTGGAPVVLIGNED